MSSLRAPRIKAKPAAPRRRGRSQCTIYREERAAGLAAGPAADPASLAAELKKACLELGRAALACKPDQPREAVQAIMKHVGYSCLVNGYTPQEESAEERRKAAAWRKVERLLDDRRFYVREAEGRDWSGAETEAERLALLDVAWRAARQAMAERSRAIRAKGDEALAAAEAAETDRRKARRRERRRQAKGAAAVRLSRAEGRR